MNSDSQREEVLFQAAAKLSGAARGPFLDGACHDDPALRARLEALLAAHEQSEGVLAETPLAPGANATLKVDFAEDRPDEAVGQKIGRYKILEKVGEGGCGVVYVAEQTEPVRRRVALKVIKLGMDTKQVVARFEAERQALAMMDHPNIARVLDAGSTEQGRPFFVMELVRGIKITEYCDQANLSTRERLDLFIQVCQAIQHAHQKGIIHRDIKPSNILVTLHDGVPVPKVIDFGIAKATEGRLTDATVYTQLHQFIGTPAYMSPEQAEMSGLDIDTRSDIYSLGVLLYELLAGSTPFDAQDLVSQGIDAMRKTIREKEPARPSTKLVTLQGNELTTLARRRSVEAAKLIRQLSGDLDWIVMKCLAKDRTRRYDTANGVAADIGRHLANEPITARPPSRLYEFQKTIRRHKFGFAAAAVMILILTAGITLATWQAKRATTALDELRATAPAFVEQARALAAKEQFNDAIEKLDYALKLRPDAAEFLVAKGDLLQCQLKLAEAAAIYREALRVKPGLARAEASAKLCDELLAAPLSDRGKLSRESLAKLYLAMQKHQRPAAECMLVARLLVEEKKLVVEYWLTRLKDLPVSAEKPLKDRLTVREDGRLALDLSGTKVTDLSLLGDAPLAVLNVSGSKELSDLSPLRGVKLIELNITDTAVADLAPLRDLNSLEKLELSGSKVADLSALSALRLKSLNFPGCPVSDLSPVRKMPLEEISLRETRVTDLAPLIGMPIKSIDLAMAPVLDFSPLARLPLEKCYLQKNRITDLSVLRGKALKELSLWGCVDARNYAVLAEIKTLELLLLPAEYRDLTAEDYAAIGSLRSLPRLRQLGSEFISKLGYAATGPKDVFWQDWDRQQTFVPVLRKGGFKFSFSMLPGGTYSLAIKDNLFGDLSILKGAQLEDLILSETRVTDLHPLAEMALSRLDIRQTQVTDLAPLRAPILSASLKAAELSGIPAVDFTPLAACTNLEWLDATNTALNNLDVVRGRKLDTALLAGTRITDISALAGMPLECVNLSRTVITNIRPLLQCPALRELVLPAHAREVRALHSLPLLSALSYVQSPNRAGPAQSAAVFWKEFDGHPWLRALRESDVEVRSSQRLDDGTWEVNLADSFISDLTILRGAPIRYLYLGQTAISDLSPLRGMPLRLLHIYKTRVADLSPLKGMKIQELHMHGTRVSDLSVLRGMPLRSLRLHDCLEVTDLSPLAEAKKLTWLTLPPNAPNIEFLRAFPDLQHIGYGEDPRNNYRPNQSAEEFWKAFSQKNWAQPLDVAGIKYSAKRNADETWSVAIESKAFSDCSVLKGAPISSLSLDRTAVTDLTPLRSLPLKQLSIRSTRVVDLTPLKGMLLDQLIATRTKLNDLSVLRGMPLKELFLGNTEVSDLEPLRGMALKRLYLYNTRVTDLSPLSGMPFEYLNLFDLKVSDLSPLAKAKGLRALTLPPNAKDIEFLRAFPKLQLLSFTADAEGGYQPDKTTAQFWVEYDAKIKLANQQQ